MRMIIALKSIKRLLKVTQETWEEKSLPNKLRSSIMSKRPDLTNIFASTQTICNISVMYELALVPKKKKGQNYTEYRLF